MKKGANSKNFDSIVIPKAQGVQKYLFCVITLKKIRRRYWRLSSCWTSVFLLSGFCLLLAIATWKENSGFICLWEADA